MYAQGGTRGAPASFFERVRQHSSQPQPTSALRQPWPQDKASWILTTYLSALLFGVPLGGRAHLLKSFLKGSIWRQKAEGKRSFGIPADLLRIQGGCGLCSTTVSYGSATPDWQMLHCALKIFCPAAGSAAKEAVADPPSNRPQSRCVSCDNFSAFPRPPLQSFTEPSGLSSMPASTRRHSSFDAA